MENLSRQFALAFVLNFLIGILVLSLALFVF